VIYYATHNKIMFFAKIRGLSWVLKLFILFILIKIIANTYHFRCKSDAWWFPCLFCQKIHEERELNSATLDVTQSLQSGRQTRFKRHVLASTPSADVNTPTTHVSDATDQKLAESGRGTLTGNSHKADLRVCSLKLVTDHLVWKYVMAKHGQVGEKRDRKKFNAINILLISHCRKWNPKCWYITMIKNYLYTLWVLFIQHDTLIKFSG